jgi:hypothetical protein
LENERFVNFRLWRRSSRFPKQEGARPELMREDILSARTFAATGLAIALLLAADCAALAREQHTNRHRIGRVVRPHGPVIVVPPFVHFGWRDGFDYYGNRRIVPKTRGAIGQNEITGSLKKRGFHDISAPKRRGSTYIVEATGALGERVRLIINGKTGGIDGVRVIGFGKR